MTKKLNNLLLTAILFLFLPIFALGQGQRYDSFASTSASASGVGNLMQAVPNAKITVCNFPGTGGTPCTNLATTYTNQTLSVACGSTTQVVLQGTSSCVANSDTLGNFGFWVPANLYTYCISANSVSTQCYSVVIGGVGSLNVDLINNVWVMGGNVYPCTQAGLTAVLAAANAVGGQIDARACSSLSVTAANNIGDGSHAVALLVPNTGTWTLSGITNGTSCFFDLKNGSSIVGNGTANGVDKLTIRGDNASNNADSIICTDASTYTRIQGGFILYNPSPGTPGTFVNGLLHWRLAFDGSVVRDISIANYGGIGAFIDSPCCGSSWQNVVLNGNNASGSIPLIIDTTTSNNNASFSCINCSVDHAATNQHEIEIKQTGSGVTGPITFYNLYVEGNTSPATVSHVEITKATGGVYFYGGEVSPKNNTEAATGIDLANVSGNFMQINGMTFQNGPSPSTRIVDNVRTVTVQGPPFPTFIPFYSTYSPSVRSESGTKTLAAGAGTATFGVAFQVAPLCTATDQTAANAVKATSSTTQITLAGTGTDVITWVCVGNPN